MTTPTNNRAKLKRNIGLSILFILLGIYLTTKKANDSTDFNPTIVVGLGVLLIVVFLLVIILSVKKLNNLNGK
jgi:uncharacterized membrane protein